MAEKRFYWLKLKRDFFKRHDIRIVEAMPNGKDYLLFYLKLLCESVDHDGTLRFSEQIPYNDEMLSVITNTNIDIVRSAIKIFTELGMMDLLDDGTIYLNEVNRMIGSAVDNDAANRKRRQREREKEQKKQALLMPCDNFVTKCHESKSKSKSKNNIKENIKRKSDKISQKELKAEFERLWKLYPRKQGKQLALQKFLKAVSDGVEIKDIENGIIAYNDYLKAKGTEEQYIKIASTWFNQRCWQDDYTITENSSVSRSRKNKDEIAAHTYNFADLEKQKLKGV